MPMVISATGNRRRCNKRVPAKQKLIEDVRQLRAAWVGAVRHEMNIETRQGRPGYAAYERAITVSDMFEERLVRLGDRILKRRVKGWDDVVALAELAAAHDAKNVGMVCECKGEVMYQDRAHETLAALLEAVLQLSRRTNIEC
jgi:hypothetical protein